MSIILLILMARKRKQHLKFLFAFYPYLFNSPDLHSYGSELRKIRTKAVADAFRGGEFWKLFCLGECGKNDSLGGKAYPGRVGGRRKPCKLAIKWASSKTVSKGFCQHNMCTFRWLFLGLCILNHTTKNAYF